MRHICLYTLDPDFHCGRVRGCAGLPEVVQEALADLKIMNPAAILCPTPREVEMKVEDRREMSPDSGRRPRDSGSRVSRRAWRHQ